MEDHLHTISCPGCGNAFKLLASEHARFCPLCGAQLPNGGRSDSPKLEAPAQNQLLSNRYQLIESIGKGGMGEVFLAFDTMCGRRIALKKIRSDLLEHPQIRHRFLKEAHITCQLTHPAIIPIYSIQAVQVSAFYTMPFVEGETLKQILRKTRQQERKGEKLDHIGGSIPALMRAFITICQAIAYAHAKGVLHRDIKPENIIIGKYGEVLILDWGLAKYIHGPLSEEEGMAFHPTIQVPQNAEITRLGKVVGTVAYMAPERALGEPATIQTDIYALGVILYQLLALRMPFYRNTLDEFRKNISKEEWTDPVLVAPYRDVPRMLSRITEKCLQPDPRLRYQTVDELIYELENYLEGRSEWFHVADLDIKCKQDWEFQEHVLIAEHIAITRITEEA
jgi:eukaryotic-like serine/threonine-protein kinase